MKTKRIWMVEKRLRKDLSQIQLAKICEVSNQTISNIEKGHRTPSGILAKKIAKALDFDMALFYEDEQSA